MIVKDEANIMARCIRSALPLIDFAFMVDTGSTDGTQAVIRECLRETGIPGEVIDEPWRDFAYNRTFALAKLREHRDIDYALINDADDQFVFDDGFNVAAFKDSMTSALYDVEIRHGAILHYRPQILGNRLPFSYRGVLHEFVEGPREGHSRETAAGFHVRIGDGGARSRDSAKFQRDAAVLERALETEQDPFLVSRYTFYLAQSYRDAGDAGKALSTYLKRPALGFWDQEVFVSLLYAARLKEQLGYPAQDVLDAYAQAAEAAPNRAEALHSASHFCQTQGRFEEGLAFAKRGVALTAPGGVLFAEPWIYEYGLLYELASNAHLSKEYQTAFDACQQLLHDGAVSPDVRTRAAEIGRLSADELTVQRTRFEPGTRPEPAYTAPREMPITIVNINPSGYVHCGAYQDLVETVRYALQRGGHEVVITDRLDGVAGRGIVFGAHLVDRHALERLPADTIIYNTEHTSSPWMNEAFINLLRRQPIWDCSEDNASSLAALLGKPVVYVPTGYAPELARVPSVPEQDIDLLFYGSLNSRRQLILDQLRANGLRVETAFGVYGRARDALIARAKVILNVHFYEPGHFEVLRVFYLMANAKAVVTECNPGEALDADLRPGLMAVPYESLVASVVSLVENDDERRALAQAGHRAIVARDEATILRSALAKVWDNGAPTATPTARLPTHMSVGSGKAWHADTLNVDISASWSPDIVADVSDRDLLNKEYSSARFGSLRLPRAYFTVVTASHLLEHVPDLVTTMTNCLNLLVNGGRLEVTVPYDLSYGAWQDPTHVRAFNERSWWYYCDWYWYLGWTEARFDVAEQVFVYSDIGEALRAAGVSAEEILRSPRAVDEVRVVLCKRDLTQAERAHGESMRGVRR
jgi:SAM-dependent methyltransferase/tetratricopeptide (TPR) repeat protein